MFFIVGITKKRENFDYKEVKICKACGAYGSYEAYMEYSVLTLFFIPTIKWDKRYFVRSTCCGSIFSVSDEIGRDLEYGRNINIREEDLIPVYINGRVMTCPNCGFKTEESYNFCPNCASKL